MKESYRRTLSSWLQQVETEVAEVRAAIASPRDGALLTQRMAGSREAALAALDRVLTEIASVAKQLDLTKREEDVMWSAYVQLLSTEISVGELTPDRWPGGPQALGDDEELDVVRRLLAGLLETITAARGSLRAARDLPPS